MKQIRMTNAQATELCLFAKDACPQQAINEGTPDTWWMLLKDLRFQDCMEALIIHLEDHSFVSPAEIRREVKKLRAGRMQAFGPIPDPPSEVGDGRAYHDWLETAKQKIADGEATSPADLGVRPIRSVPRPAELEPPTSAAPPSVDDAAG